VYSDSLPEKYVSALRTMGCPGSNMPKGRFATKQELDFCICSVMPLRHPSGCGGNAEMSYLARRHRNRGLLTDSSRRGAQRCNKLDCLRDWKRRLRYACKRELSSCIEPRDGLVASYVLYPRTGACCAPAGADFPSASHRRWWENFASARVYVIDTCHGESEQ
jgi:hypothetical protein